MSSTTLEPEPTPPTPSDPLPPRPTSETSATPWGLSDRTIDRLLAVALAAVLTLLVVATFLVFRPEPSAPARPEVWVPDCSQGVDVDGCEAEAVARQYLAAWRSGEDVTPYVADGFTAPARRTPLAEISYEPSVTVQGDRATVLLWLKSNGELQVQLARTSDGWRVTSAR